jgi:dephospho-CoA kinase
MIAVSHRALIGLTGGIGSGKSTVADTFAALGAGVVDTDQIAHRLTAPNGAAMPAILAEFGTTIADTTGAMDRAAMRELVFSDSLARRRLEAILHPMIGAETTRALEAVDGPYRIVVVPLLVEGRHWRSRVDRVLVVDCPRALQIERVIQRNGLALDQIEAILDAQATREERLAQADDVIDNAGSPAALPAQINALHAEYCQLRGRF